MKRIIRFLFVCLTWPFAHLGWPWLCAKLSILWRNIYAAYVKQRFGRCGSVALSSTRLHLSGMKHMTLGHNVEIGFDVRLQCLDRWDNAGQRFTPRLIIHDHVVLAPLSRVGCINHVEIGEYTTMGARCYITDHTHGGTTRAELEMPPRHRPLVSRGPVKIGRCVHLGEGVCVMPGVTIGDYSVIGAGSVVTRDIPPYSIAVGSPAKVIKTIEQ